MSTGKSEMAQLLLNNVRQESTRELLRLLGVTYSRREVAFRSTLKESSVSIMPLPKTLPFEEGDRITTRPLSLLIPFLKHLETQIVKIITKISIIIVDVRSEGWDWCRWGIRIYIQFWQRKSRCALLLHCRMPPIHRMRPVRALSEGNTYFIVSTTVNSTTHEINRTCLNCDLISTES